MQEFKLKNNNSGLKVYINGIPQVNAIPNDKLDILIESIALHIENHYKRTPKKTKKEDND